MKENTVLKINELTKDFELGHERISILDGVNLDIKAKECVIIMGPSGSGKTTFLNLLAGIDREFSGSINIAGFDLSELNSKEISNMRSSVLGMVFQDYRLLPQLTAYENVEAPLFLQNYSVSERKSKAMNALDLVGLSNRSKHKPEQLSGGERQRTAIARSLVTGADIILCDEPTGNLNKAMSKMIFDLLQSLCHEFGKSIIMTTHDQMAEDYADRVINLENGKFVEKALKTYSENRK
jgi:putative ABC transport system ATP-binding protein